MAEASKSDGAGGNGGANNSGGGKRPTTWVDVVVPLALYGAVTYFGMSRGGAAGGGGQGPTRETTAGVFEHALLRAGEVQSVVIDVPAESVVALVRHNIIFGLGWWVFSPLS